jgi:L-fuconolactonase
MRIDSHQHFWSYDPTRYPWIKPEWPIRRSFLPDALEPELKACQLDGCVAVQARQTLEESVWLLELADRFPFIKGVVGWVDLRSPDAGAQLGKLAKHPKSLAVRHVLQDESDDDFMLGVDFQRGISRLREFDLKYDLLVFPRQLTAAIKLVAAHPNQPFVLDHIAKPPIKEGLLEPWRENIQELACFPNVWCKVSGLVTEADWQSWRPADFRPYLDVVFNAFGVDRLMYGSDWPVALLAGAYRQVYELAREYVLPLGAEAEAKFFGGNAAKFYHLI